MAESSLYNEACRFYESLCKLKENGENHVPIDIRLRKDADPACLVKILAEFKAEQMTDYYVFSIDHAIALAERYKERMKLGAERCISKIRIYERIEELTVPPKEEGDEYEWSPERDSPAQPTVRITPVGDAYAYERRDAPQEPDVHPKSSSVYAFVKKRGTPVTKIGDKGDVYLKVKPRKKDD
ncbi:MAG: hypothetical protein KKE20_03950 [Nanoarchaeota archaeon]|nr:hypothetical protein [Nanoarchaeota archaeon]